MLWTNAYLGAISPTMKRLLKKTIASGKFGVWFSAEDDSRLQKSAARRNSIYSLVLCAGNDNSKNIYIYLCVTHTGKTVSAQRVHLALRADYCRSWP